ncbi:MAG: hypothetical protein DYG94_13070 [Leptolyngbya sp. PLA3]|nr:MAG: hypothetical protein EDM82_03245 [Cyanobacteria bacterium CYA]MCE7969657.1 hypothetical protein [Leptolyngbya sp. PL-A3]
MTAPSVATAGVPCAFFDDARGVIAPLADLRASFDIRTAALTTFDRLTRILNLEPIALFVPSSISALVAQEHPGLPINTLPPCDDQDAILLINGRCVLPLDVLVDLEPGQAAVEERSGDLIAARLARGRAARLLAGDPSNLDMIAVHDPVLLRRPWEIITFRDRALSLDLNVLLSGQGADLSNLAIVAGEYPLRVHPSARVFPGAMFDLSKGPIVIDDGAELRPGAIIIGPAYIGPSSVVTEHGVIRSNTAVGPVCKVGGEVTGAVFQGWSNKAHEGFLGDSWVGAWVNLGAGTITSNLLNTYTEISSVADAGLSRERTGLQFFGSVLADHVKTAISTRLMGGSIVHTGAMWAASRALSDCVGRFAWVTDAGSRLFRLPRFMETMEAMMARRAMQPSPAYRALIEQLHQDAGA